MTPSAGSAPTAADRTALPARLAEVLVHVGVNLAPGQRLLIAEPFELQGVSREAAPLVRAVTACALAAGAAGVETLWGEPALLREAARTWPDEAFEERLGAQTDRLVQAIRAGDALLFLESSHPRLLEGLAPRRVAQLRARCRAFFARVSPALVAGLTPWCVAPAPTPEWADAVFPELPAAERIDALWRAIGAACRLETASPPDAWREHLAGLEGKRNALEARGQRALRYRGPGTDLRVALPARHRWCTAQLRTPAGQVFVPNLPTEEVFTAPQPGSAEGVLRVARPVAVDGRVVRGIELEFRGGEIVEARAEEGAEALQHLLETDDGATRLGELAWVPRDTAIARTGRCFLHPLLDENALPHVALGDGYAFTLAPDAQETLNRSAVHLDLPIDADVEFE